MNSHPSSLPLASLVAAVVLTACGDSAPGNGEQPRQAATPPEIYGTLEPFIDRAVYFVVTDRFVNGDPENDHRDQGGEHPTFDRPLAECDGVTANVGYLGGDFQGLAEHAGYIAEMGFGAVWITPVVDNPDQAFTGGDSITCDSILTDLGKTGYHGYWGMNFFTVDEHLPSPGMGFRELSDTLENHGLKLVLDIVGNHSSPGWTMPEKQPGFGQVFTADGTLVADHGNLPPEQLTPETNPLHAWYNTEPGLAQLANFDTDNPEVVDYLTEAYLHWIAEGADAFRIDTIPWAPHRFWKEFTVRGMPVVYYGSESGFMRGRAEHAGNRNYFGAQGIANARTHPIRTHLARIAHARAQSIALQRGRQAILELSGHRAAFYRVYQHTGEHQIALVLLNKGDAPERFEISRGLQAGAWRSALNETALEVAPDQPLVAEVPAHGVAIFLLDAPVEDPELLAMLP